jgi:hypothetical protein
MSSECRTRAPMMKKYAKKMQHEGIGEEPKEEEES